MRLPRFSTKGHLASWLQDGKNCEHDVLGAILRSRKFVGLIGDRNEYLPDEEKYTEEALFFQLFDEAVGEPRHARKE